MKKRRYINDKITVPAFIVIIIVIFAYYFITLQTVNPIDPRNEYRDYKTVENTDTRLETINIVSYRVIGQIEEITSDELKIRTFERVVTIKKPEAIGYFAFPTVPIDESKLRKNDHVRATVDADKITGEIVKLSVDVIGYDTQGGEFKRTAGTSK